MIDKQSLFYILNEIAIFIMLISVSYASIFFDRRLYSNPILKFFRACGLGAGVVIIAIDFSTTITDISFRELSTNLFVASVFLIDLIRRIKNDLTVRKQKSLEDKTT